VLNTSKRLLPYEPGYTGDWEAEKRRKETKAWLRKREREIAAACRTSVKLLPPRSSQIVPN